MKRPLRLLIWPGALILLVLAIIAVNAALVIIATSSAPDEPVDRGGAQTESDSVPEAEE